MIKTIMNTVTVYPLSHAHQHSRLSLRQPQLFTKSFTHVLRPITILLFLN